MKVKSHIVPQHSDILRDYQSDHFRGETVNHPYSAVDHKETYWQCEWLTFVVVMMKLPGISDEIMCLVDSAGATSMHQ
jgi:hypothetical protein